MTTSFPGRRRSMLLHTKFEKFDNRWLMAAVFVFAQSLFSFSVAAEACAVDAPRLPPDALTGATCPNIGRMGETKLAVPQNYVLGPDFVYESQDVWKGASDSAASSEQSFSSPIRYFSLRLRLPSLAPAKTRQDVIDFTRYLSAKSPSIVDQNEWVLVQFNSRSAAMQKTSPVDFRDLLARYVSGTVDGLAANPPT